MTQDSDTSGPSIPSPGEAERLRSMGAGGILRREREKRQISIETVAKTLRLNPRYIEALEANKYDQLPGDTYIRVYLRSLSRYFSLDSEDIFQQFFQERGLTGADTLRKDSRTKINLAAQEEKKNNTALIAVFSAIALLAVFSFVINRQGCHSASASKSQKTIGDSALLSAQAAEKSKEAEPVRHPAPLIDSQKVKRNAEAAAPLRIKADTNLKAPAHAAMGAKTVNSPDTAVQKTVKSGDRPAEKTAIIPAKSDSMKPAGLKKDTSPTDRNIPDSLKRTGSAKTAAQTMVLKMTVVGDSCWGRIISDGAREWKNTVLNGRSATFTASDSFNVHVGIGDAVSFTLNGKPLELPKKKGVVTFKVDKSGSLTLWPIDKWNSVFEKR
jgi:cytoskeleton protein RodZ